MAGLHKDIPDEINPAAPPRRRKRLRWLKRTFLTLLFGLPVALFTFFQIVNWQGARALERMRAQLKAAEESIDRVEFQVEQIPAEDNFFATPALDGIAQMTGNDDMAGPAGIKRKALRLVGDVVAGSFKGSYDLEKTPDWSEWRKNMEKFAKATLSKAQGDSVREMLDAFETHRSIFDELIAASTRPRAQIQPTLLNRAGSPGEMKNHSPHISPLLIVGKAAQIQAWLTLATGQVDRAAGLIRIVNHLRDGFAGDASMISCLSAIFAMKLASSVVMEGIRKHQWTEILLAEWQRGLEEFDVKEVALNSMRWDMAVSFSNLPVFSRMEKPAFEAIFVDEEGKTNALLVRYGPRGWIEQNQAAQVDLMLRFCITPLKVNGFAGVLSQESAYAAAVKSASAGALPGRRSAMKLLYSYGKVLREFCYSDVWRRQLILACALERHYLKHGSHPSKLEDISKEVLKEIPLDLDGQPMRYSATMPGVKYRLWSVGADLKDDWKGSRPHGVKDVEHRLSDWILTLH